MKGIISCKYVSDYEVDYNLLYLTRMKEELNSYLGMFYNKKYKQLRCVYVFL